MKSTAVPRNMSALYSYKQTLSNTNEEDDMFDMESSSHVFPGGGDSDYTSYRQLLFRSRSVSKHHPLRLQCSAQTTMAGSNSSGNQVCIISSDGHHVS